MIAAFIFGVIAGGCAGVMVAALAMAAKENTEEEENEPIDA